MVEPRNRYILLQDCVGDFIIDRFALGLPPRVTPTRVLKGELMEALPESEQPDDSTRIALAGVDRKHLRLECGVKDVTRLPRKGVKSERNKTDLNARSGPQGISEETVRNVDDSFCVPDTGVFVGLDELSLNLEDLDSNKTPTKLEIGQRVVTFIKNVCTRGTVRYISEEKDSTGHAHTVVGLELDEKRGTGTGKWKKKQPFSCKKGYAAFVGIETVIAEKEFSGDHGEAAIMSCDHGNITSETLQRNSRDLEGQFNYLKGLLREKEEDEVNLIRQLRQSEKQNEKVQRELMKIEEDLTSLQEQLRQKESGEARLQEQFREIEGQKQNLERQLTRMEQQLREKEQQEDNLQFQLREMKQQLSNCRGQLQEKVSEEEKLQEKLRGNENQLLEKERQEEYLQSQLREMEQQLIILQRDKERENANLKDKLSVKMRDIDILEREARDQVQDIVDLQRDFSAAKETLSKYESQLKTRDWVLSRDELLLTDKCLGEGGWGRVLEGKYCGCAVAIKKLKESTLTPQARSLFEREMDIASRCRHPCLLQFIGATTDERCPLFVTELMETSLRALLGRRQLSEIEVTVISLDVSRALNYLHQRKPKPIVHRDVSSANVLLWKQYDQWRGKLGDYGTAKFVQQIMTKYAGALCYGAPEAGSCFNQTVKMDVYSFGVLLCEMCIESQLPDPDMREEQVALVTNKGFQGLILWCLEEDPDLRPSMEEIIEKLEQLHLIISETIKLA